MWTAATRSRRITGTTRTTTVTVRGTDHIMAGRWAGIARGTAAIGVVTMAVIGEATTVAGVITIMAITEVIMAVDTITEVIMPIVPITDNPVVAVLMAADGRRQVAAGRRQVPPEAVAGQAQVAAPVAAVL